MAAGLSLRGSGITVTDTADATNVTVGTTTITGGSTGNILYDNAGVLGEMTTTGSGTVVALATNPTLTGPTVGSVAWASLPAAGTAGRMYRVSNAGTKGSLWMDDGTRWKPFNGSAVLATLDTTSASIPNTPTVVFQYQMPAAFWQVGDRIRIHGNVTKSGTTDNLVYAARIGTLGTTGDAAIISSTVLVTTQLVGSFIHDIRLQSATTCLLLGRNDLGYGGSSTNSINPAVTISNVSNALWVSVIVSSTGATNTVALQDGQISLVSSAN